MKKYSIIGAVMTLALVFTFTAVGSTLANTMRQGATTDITDEERAEFQEARESITETIENGDYETFKSLIAELPNGEEKLEKMTEERFAEMTEKHAERAQMQESREAVKEAVANGDYETWKSLVSETPRGEDVLEKINEDNFDRLVEAHALMEEGRAKMQEAKAIMDELGLEKPEGHKGMKGEGKRVMQEKGGAKKVFMNQWNQ